MKDKRICWHTDEQTYQLVRDKARRYGIPMSELTRLATGAYVRAFDEVPEEGARVAVNYAVWLRCESLLADIERELRDSTRQLVATRRAVQALQEAGGAGDLASATEAILACHGTVLDVRARLERARTVHDAACRAILVIDNHMGAIDGKKQGA